MDHRTPLLIDSHGRILRDLRVSVTDRCNFRCLYCLPETEAAANFCRDRWAKVVNSTPIARQWKPKSKILTFEELERFVRLAVGLGTQKVRLTGSEPLLRQEMEILVERLAAISGIEDLAMTSNGFLANGAVGGKAVEGTFEGVAGGFAGEALSFTSGPFRWRGFQI